MWNPPGYQAGVHVPGTTVPIAHAVAAANSAPVAPVPHPESETERADRVWDAERLAEIQTVTDPTERLVRAVAAFTLPTTRQIYGRGGRRTTELTVWGGGRSTTYLVEKVCPGWNSSCTDVGSYDDNEVAAWFANEARTRDIKPQTVVSWPEPRKTIFGKVSVLPSLEVALRDGADVGVWKIPRKLVSWNSSILTPSRDAMIADDGRLFVGYTWETGRVKPGMDVGGRLRVSALTYLAEILGYPVKQ